ncbi:MAG TPA: phospholipid carrier-dependent glycosyltransferase [Candidatus Limnocylindria bacterium]|nr:phospholipid carrier-dependent glycosyltransferase [Candidatus Limnocylindria bacterium]
MTTEAAGRRRANLAILAIVVAGVVLRLLVTRAPGFPSDVGTFMAWAEKLAAVGPAHFYEPGYFSDYPPGFLYVLWALGALFDGDVLRFAVKAISIPADIGIVLLAVPLVRRTAGHGAAILAAGVWMLQPAPIFAGPYWGQVDAVGTVPFFAALVAAGARRWWLAGLLAGLALMTKPQFGLALGVVLVAALVELARRRDWRPLARSAGAALATLVALAIPFGMSPGAFVGLVRSASETYPYSSLYAFNGWSIALDFWKDDAGWFLPGGILLAIGLLASVIPLWWRRDTAALLAVGAATVLAFYFLPTRAHERYLFPALALLLPFAVTRARFLLPYLVFAGEFFVTLYFAFTRYPQNDLQAPDWLDATVFGRTGQIAIALLMIGTAAFICWRLARGEARLEPTLVLDPELVPTLPEERARRRLPAGFAIGGPATRRDILLALVIALAVLGTRGFRLDWPRDMYFDEVYHARTAFELLAQREPYEWTHPHLAKEIMALGILAFGDTRVVGTEPAPPNVTAFGVTGDGTRIFGLADGTIEVRARDHDDVRVIGRVGSTPRSVAIVEDHVYVVADRDLADLSLTRQHADLTRPLPAPPLAAAIVAGRLVVGSATATTVYESIDAAPAVLAIGAVGIAQKNDGSEAYLLDPDGGVHVIETATWTETKIYPSVAKERAVAYAQGPNAIVLARADEPTLDSISTDDGHRDTVPLANSRTGTFANGVSAMAVVPRTDFLYAIADGRIVVVDVHGLSPFAAIPTRATSLGVDGTGDTLVALSPSGSADRIETGRLALAWRLPGVVAGALLAFVLVLLARRLFASRLVPALVGVAVIVDGSMFAQARIGMNDVYVGLFIVAGWYFIVAAHRPRRSAALDILIAGVLLGLGAASKWAAVYTLAGVLVAALAVTAYAYERGRPGTGGPLDLLAGKGRNAAFLFLSFAVIPVGIYLASYVRWFGGPTAPYGWDLVELTKQMYWYHSGLTSPHPAASPWWSWPFVLKPVYWYFGQSDGGNNAYIYDAGNIALFWAALAATVWCAIAAIRARSATLGFVVFAMLVQYVAWIPISRVLFFYHFFTALPFYLLALACALAYLWETGRSWRVIGFLAVAIGTFAYFYPFVSGQPVPGAQAAMFFVLPTWQYDCQFYPSFVCPITAPTDLPVAAVVLRLAGAVALAALAAGAFYVLRAPDRALASARAALGRNGRRGSDAG